MKNTLENSNMVYMLLRGTLFFLSLLCIITNDLQAQCTAPSCPNGIVTINAGNFATQGITVASGETKCLVIDGSFTLGGTLNVAKLSTLNICTTDPSYIVTIPDLNWNLASTGGKDWSNGGAVNVNVNCKILTDKGSYNNDLILTIGTTGSLNITNSTAAHVQFNGSKIVNNGYLGATAISTIYSFIMSGPVTNTGTLYSNNIMSFNSGASLTNSGVVESLSHMNFNSGPNINDGNILAGCKLTINAGAFDNNNFVGSSCGIAVNTAITNNGLIKSSGSLTLNAAGTFNFQGGLFDIDTLILNGGNINAGTGCAAFIVRMHSNIQNGSAFTSSPANSVGIYDVGNPGAIDNVSGGCDGGDLAPFNTGPYCGIIPLTGVGGAGGSSGCFATLPVTWISYSARQLNDQQIKIDWSTAQEVNNNFFTVQRSYDGVNFDNVGKVTGSGNSNQTHTYTYVDNFNYNGIVFYRLAQTDFDGKINYSDIIAVSCSNHKGLSFDVFPNPAASDNEISISVAGLEENSEVLVVLMDQLGKSIFTKAFIIENNDILVAIGKEMNLSKGVYFVSASSNQSIVTKKLIVE
jgi:hypothetical protein